MPTYEYACGACGHEFEREQRITEDPVKSCPRCKRRRVQRLISQTSFVLKGGGWYSDLYSSKSPKKEGGDAGGKEESPAKSESKDDAPSKKKPKKSKDSKAAA